MSNHLKLAQIFIVALAMILIVSHMSEAASTGKEVLTGGKAPSNASVSQQQPTRSVSGIPLAGTTLLRAKRRGGGGGGKGGSSGIGSGIASGVAGAAAGGILGNILQG